LPATVLSLTLAFGELDFLLSPQGVPTRFAVYVAAIGRDVRLLLLKSVARELQCLAVLGMTAHLTFSERAELVDGYVEAR
jgi:hypothetical protein